MILIVCRSFGEAEGAARYLGLRGHTWQWVASMRTLLGTDKTRFRYLIIGNPADFAAIIAELCSRGIRPVTLETARDFLPDKTGRPFGAQPRVRTAEQIIAAQYKDRQRRAAYARKDST